jgi:hypothetical protein
LLLTTEWKKLFCFQEIKLKSKCRAELFCKHYKRHYYWSKRKALAITLSINVSCAIIDAALDKIIVVFVRHVNVSSIFGTLEPFTLYGEAAEKPLLANNVFLETLKTEVFFPLFFAENNFYFLLIKFFISNKP